MGYTLGRRAVSAKCKTCGWQLESLNAQGVGAQHARKRGHEVTVEVVQYINYGPEGTSPKAKVKR